MELTGVSGRFYLKFFGYRNLGSLQLIPVSFDIIRMNKPIKLDVFGKLVLAINSNDGWEMFYLSEGGKRRLATEIFVPNFVKETEIENYIEDICHEWATEKHPNVRRLN
jgi:hypothetical protein